MASVHVKGVLDLTFMDIKEEQDLQNALNSDRVQSIPMKTLNESSPSKGSSSPEKRRKEEITAVRIANNEIANASILCSPIGGLLDGSKITWLDLSFNQISILSDDILRAFPNVSTLYLQANKVSRLSEIKKLQELKDLKSLALYGNPVEEHKHYRNYVLFHCKKLKNFDMSPVIESERKMVSVSYESSCVPCAIPVIICVVADIFFCVMIIIRFAFHFQNDIWVLTFRKKLFPDEDY
jgi:Leucine-rich repeat